jgi:hypothetical protein
MLVKGKASQAVLDLCEKCDCVAKPDQECCKPKCGEVFKNPFSNLALFDECCKSTPAQPECQCNAIVTIIPGASGLGYDMKTQKSSTMNNCCNQLQSQSELSYATYLGCENCPINGLCCPEFIKDVKGYTSKYSKINPRAFEQFELTCCANEPKWKEKGCPEPVCTGTFQDVRCCDSLVVGSPNDDNMKSCCHNKNWADKKGVCPCAERDNSNEDKYPRCCTSSFNAEKCCKNVEVEYNSDYKDKCCK